MRDLRNEMYASATNEDRDNNLVEEDFSTYVTKEEFNRVTKLLERKITLLESKIANITGNGWDHK